MRAVGHYRRRRSDWRSPGSRARSVRACQGLRPRRVAQALAMARPCVLPSADRTASAPGSNFLRGSMAGLHVPLSTLRRAPHDAQRMTRGQHGSQYLCCEGLAPFAPCRSPGAPDRKLSPGGADITGRFCGLGRAHAQVFGTLMTWPLANAVEPSKDWTTQTAYGVGACFWPGRDSAP